jgi:phospholipid/cholesterol/gamma-HCH transport system substrate-binding protein
MRRAARENLKEVIALVVLVLVALVTTIIILHGQKFTLPGSVPLLGNDRFELKGDFATSQAVTPGQGQAIEIAGVRVGDISKVELVDGHAQVTMQVEDKYVKLIHPDASMLLRPKTGLNDMVIELDPGTAPGEVKDGSVVPLSNTEPPVNPDEILSTLDDDTRNYLKLLLAGGGEALKGRGPALSATLRRIAPTTRDIAAINGLLSERRASISRSIHNFGLLAGELGNKDQELTSFIDSSNQVLGSFARQEASIRSALRELPGALRETHGALQGTNQLALEATPALHKLIPGARALAPALQHSRTFFNATTAPIRDQIRPFTRQIQEPLIHVRQIADGLNGTIPDLSSATTTLNGGLNALAYNPPGPQEGFLFYLPWLNHDTNSIFLTQDGMGPLRRGIVMLSCQTANVAEGVTAIRPFLQTLLQATNAPTSAQIC